jgi:hypothetical protein
VSSYSSIQPTEPKAVLFLLLIVLWWFIRHQPADDSASDDDGGMKTQSVSGRHPHRPRPGSRGPKAPRRGPHGDPTPTAPTRIRTLRARARHRQGT